MTRTSASTAREGGGRARRAGRGGCRGRSISTGRSASMRGEHQRRWSRAAGRRRAGAPGGTQLVAGRGDRDADAAADGERAVPAGRGERDAGGGEALARARSARRPGRSRARAADVAAEVGGPSPVSGEACRLRARASSWTSTVSAPAGTAAPVKMRDGLAAADRARERPPPAALSPIDAPRAGQVGEADRIAVHRREIGGGLGAERRAMSAAAQRPAACAQRRVLNRERGGHGKNAGLRL